MTAPIYASFVGGTEGPWIIRSMSAVIGEGLAFAERLAVFEGATAFDRSLPAAFTLRGVVGHTRYVQRSEKDALARVQPVLGRPEASCAAFIPIRKSAAWWDLAQDERRAIVEERSHHMAEGLKYLPAIARRLYQAREIGEAFDFLTWFEYAPKDAHSFEELTVALRSTEEWTYVEREVDIRLVRAGDG